MSRRAGIVAACAAAVLVIAGASAWVVASSGTPGALTAPHVQPAIVPAGTPPPPPHGALVLARGDGDLAVGLAARRSGATLGLTATLLTGAGTGLGGMHVRFAADGRSLPPARSCGTGCYTAAGRASAPARRVTVALSGRGRASSTVIFALPAHWPVSAEPLLRGADRVFRELHSVVFREHLSSGRPGVTVDTVWRSEAPDRLSYHIAGGGAGVIIGGTRWDLVVGGSWQRSSQDPQLVMPSPPWGRGVYDVSLLGGGRFDGRPVVRFSMFEPSVPAWYTVTVDRQDLRTLNVSMTAAAHFMLDHYVAFNAPRQIRPPVGK